MSKSALVGQFFFSRDKQTLYYITERVGPAHYLVEAYQGHALQEKKVMPLGLISGFQLYPSMADALQAVGGAR